MQLLHKAAALFQANTTTDTTATASTRATAAGTTAIRIAAETVTAAVAATRRRTPATLRPSLCPAWEDDIGSVRAILSPAFGCCAIRRIAEFERSI